MPRPLLARPARPARSARRGPAAAAVLALLLPLAACGGDDEPDAAPTPGAPAASTPAVDETATAQPSQEPSQEPSATVAPATGVLLRLANAQFRAPEGWKEAPFLIDMTTEARPPGGGGAARLNAIEMPAGSTDDVPIARQARYALQSSSLRPRPKQLEPVEIAGVQWYHLSGKVNDYKTADYFGTIHDGYQVGVDFEFPADVPRAERERMIAESLASFSWR